MPNIPDHAMVTALENWANNLCAQLDAATDQMKARASAAAASRAESRRRFDADIAATQRILDGWNGVRHLRVVGSEPVEPAPVPDPPLATVIPFPR